MKIKVLGSSSKGNCYLLQLKTETLILECGVSYKKILEGLNYELDKVVGCLISHEHKDHSKSIKELTENGINIYTSKGTLEKIDIKNHRTKIIESERSFKVGGFKVMPFKTEHDAAEPLGFLIQHKEIGKLLFLTDSYFCSYKFKGLDHALIECNYSKELLDKNIENGIIKIFLRNRIVKSHFELSNMIDFLKNCNLKDLKTLTLIHLSADNSDKDMFKKEVERNIGLPVEIAETGKEIYL